MTQTQYCGYYCGIGIIGVGLTQWHWPNDPGQWLWTDPGKTDPNWTPAIGPVKAQTLTDGPSEGQPRRTQWPRPSPVTQLTQARQTVDRWWRIIDWRQWPLLLTDPMTQLTDERTDSGQLDWWPDWPMTEDETVTQPDPDPVIGGRMTQLDNDPMMTQTHYWTMTQWQAGGPIGIDPVLWTDPVTDPIGNYYWPYLLKVLVAQLTAQTGGMTSGQRTIELWQKAQNWQANGPNYCGIIDWQLKILLMTQWQTVTDS